MANILDDLFQWAAQQPARNIITVRLAIATNEITRNNLVSYAEGSLFYEPATFAGFFWRPARFVSESNAITQYFSDRRYIPSGGGIISAPFDANNTDPLTVAIVAPFLSQNYTIELISSKWNFEFTIAPTFDVSTEIFYGTQGSSLITFSLCNRNSEPPPQ